MKRKNIQIVFNGTSLITSSTYGTATIKILKNNITSILYEKDHFSLVIINLNKKLFSYIDPKTDISDKAQVYFENFKRYLIFHNQIYNTNYDTSGWSYLSLNHPLQEIDNDVDSGIYALAMLDNLITTNTVQVQDINIVALRRKFAHLILQSLIKRWQFTD